MITMFARRWMGPVLAASGESCVLAVGYTSIFNRDRAFFLMIFFHNSER